MIPDEAVEAAARVLCGVTSDMWKDQPTRIKDKYRWEAIAALEAAAPHLMASRQSLAEVLAAHQLHSGERGMNRRCKCGWLVQVFGNDIEKDFITHQADMLTVVQRKGITP